MSAKSPSKHVLNAQVLSQEDILGQPIDLLKLVFVFNECICDYNPKDMSFRRYVVNKVLEVFDDSGEEAIKLCFDIAVNYGFIVSKVQNDHKIRYELNSRNELDLSHDWFCFDCDVLVDKRSQQFLKCCNCFRVFHRKCIEFFELTDYYCMFCKRVTEWERDGFVGKSKVDQKRVNVLIRYSIDFIKNKMKTDFEKFETKLDTNQSIVVYKPMDLLQMIAKTDKNEYKSVSKFEDDFLVYMHNLMITSFHFDVIAADFLRMRQYLIKEIAEMRHCVDCYERSNNKALQESNKDWFCEPCDPPHEVLFVKVKGFPPWPSKVIYWHEDGKRINVRFFDSHLRRMDVKPADTSRIDDMSIRNSAKHNQKLVKPMEMLEKYLKLSAMKKSANDWKDMSETSDDLFINSSFDKRSAEMDESIDEVIQEGNRTKRGRKKKTTTPAPSTATTAPNPSTSTTAPIPSTTPILTHILAKSEFFKSDNCVNSISSKVPNLRISEPEVPTLKSVKAIYTELKDRRKSNPLAHNQNIGSNSETNEQNTTQFQQKSFTPEVIEIEDNDQMEVSECDVTQHTGEQNTSNPIMSRNENPTQPQSSAYFPLKRCFESNQLQTNNLSLTSNLIQNPRNSNESQNHSVVNQSNDSFGQDFNENSTQFERKIKELMANKEQTMETNTMKEKLILIEYYHKQQMNALEQQLTETRKQLTETQKQLANTKCELKDCKTKNWCVVCLQSAQFYCCLRYYCSVKCQTADWINGHYSQCLTQ